MNWRRAGRVRFADRTSLLHSTVARMALAWVRMRPGVTSTIIGARRVNQLEENLKSTEIALNAEELIHLDSLTSPHYRSRKICVGLRRALLQSKLTRDATTLYALLYDNGSPADTRQSLSQFCGQLRTGSS